MEGYFVHYFAAENLPPLGKYVIFVLDISGSMGGRKLKQLKEYIKYILDDLSFQNDFFSIITFSSYVQVLEVVYTFKYTLCNIQFRFPFYFQFWDPTPSASSPGPIQRKACFSSWCLHFPATEVNILTAKAFIDSLSTAGGTNIHAALTHAIDLAERTTRVDLKEFPSKPQPLILFLTDGTPTEGETNAQGILEKIKSANSVLRIPIYSLGFGKGADFHFLQKLSLQNFAFSRKIYEGPDAVFQLNGFYHEIASPLLSDVAFDYTASEFKMKEVTATSFPNVFRGNEVVIAGRIDLMKYDDVSNEDFCSYYQDQILLRVDISGTGTRGRIDKVESPPTQCMIPSPSSFKNEDQLLERLWAYLTIKQLIIKDLTMDDTEPPQIRNQAKESPKEQAIRLAMKVTLFNILCKSQI